MPKPTIKELQAHIEKLEERIKTLEEEKPKDVCKPWRASSGDNYWYVDTDGELMEVVEDYMKEDEFRYNTANYYNNELQAQEAKEFSLACGALIHKAYELTGGEFMPGEGEEAWVIGYNRAEKVFEPRFFSILLTGGPYFKTEEAAQQAIKDLGEETLKTLFEV